ncbi:hypothetical protein [Streptomyces sp. NPDC002580]|uniref:hypothetical protein n=1 Tax=Streptomyces sp. NPDC002580 TaxID=3364653 RepID=UPI0036976691
MSVREPAPGELPPGELPPDALPPDALPPGELPPGGDESGRPRHEPAPAVGKLLIRALLFVLAAVVVVAGGVSLS